MAEAFKEWIPLVLQDAECFFSSEDIRAGQRWGTEIQAWLSETDFGVLCVTAENVKAPWLNFEAGALSKKLNDESRVVPITLGFSPGNLDEPLKQFNGVEATRSGILKLMRSLAEVAGSKVDIERTFDRWWPDLEEKLNAIPELVEPVQPPEPPDQNELLAEIHGIVRGIARDLHRGYNPALPIDLPEPGPLARATVELARREAIRREFDRRYSDMREDGPPDALEGPTRWLVQALADIEADADAEVIREAKAENRD